MPPCSLPRAIASPPLPLPGRYGRADIDERAPHEQQPADDAEGEWERVRRQADCVVEPACDVLAHGPSIPAQPENHGEKEADGNHAEPPSSG